MNVEKLTQDNTVSDATKETTTASTDTEATEVPSTYVRHVPSGTVEAVGDARAEELDDDYEEVELRDGSFQPSKRKRASKGK